MERANGNLVLFDVSDIRIGCCCACTSSFARLLLGLPLNRVEFPAVDCVSNLSNELASICVGRIVSIPPARLPTPPKTPLQIHRALFGIKENYVFDTSTNAVRTDLISLMLS